jgi:hypothetical protein
MAIGMLEIDIEGAATLRNLQVALQSVSPASIGLFLESVAHPIIISRMQARFASEGDSASGPWLPLESSTQSFRSNQGFAASHPINHRTGELERWLTHAQADIFFSGPGAEYVFPGEMPGNHWLQVKFETAQVGKSQPETAARPVVAINENDHRLVREALANYIAARMNSGIL